MEPFTCLASSLPISSLAPSEQLYVSPPRDIEAAALDTPWYQHVKSLLLLPSRGTSLQTAILSAAFQASSGVFFALKVSDSRSTKGCLRLIGESTQLLLLSLALVVCARGNTVSRGMGESRPPYLATGPGGSGPLLFRHRHPLLAQQAIYAPFWVPTPPLYPLRAYVHILGNDTSRLQCTRWSG